MDIAEILGYIASAIGGGGLMSIINWRINKKKASVEVKVDEIKALNDTITLVYEPLIKQQKERIQDLESEVKDLREQLSTERKDRQRDLELMNKRILAITNAIGLKSYTQIRDAKGRYVKVEESYPNDEK